MCQKFVIHLLNNLKKTNKKTVKQKRAEKHTKISYINCLFTDLIHLIKKKEDTNTSVPTQKKCF